MVKLILILFLVSGCSPANHTSLNDLEAETDHKDNDNSSDFATSAITGAVTGVIAGAATSMLINKITDKDGKTKYVDSQGKSFTKEQYENQIRREKNKTKKLKRKLKKIKKNRRKKRRRRKRRR